MRWLEALIHKIREYLLSTLGASGERQIQTPQALGCDTLCVATLVTGLALRLLGVLKSDEVFPIYANAPMYAMGLRPRIAPQIDVGRHR